jgi:hypothetical protein
MRREAWKVETIIDPRIHWRFWDKLEEKPCSWLSKNWGVRGGALLLAEVIQRAREFVHREEPIVCGWRAKCPETVKRKSILTFQWTADKLFTKSHFGSCLQTFTHNPSMFSVPGFRERIQVTIIVLESVYACFPSSMVRKQKMFNHGFTCQRATSGARSNLCQILGSARPPISEVCLCLQACDPNSTLSKFRFWQVCQDILHRGSFRKSSKSSLRSAWKRTLPIFRLSESSLSGFSGVLEDVSSKRSIWRAAV